VFAQGSRAPAEEEQRPGPRGLGTGSHREPEDPSRHHEVEGSLDDQRNAENQPKVEDGDRDEPDHPNQPTVLGSDATVGLTAPTAELNAER
jgi:hypothetical protein